MLSDEIPPGRALDIARNAVLDSIRLHRALQDKLKNRILRYQYDALDAELRQQEHAIDRLKKSTAPVRDRPGDNAFRDRPPDDATLANAPPDEILRWIAQHDDAMVASFADMSSRVDEPELKTLLHELSEAAFSRKCKALTDLQLMTQHRDYR
jgi:hypothetical protein